MTRFVLASSPLVGRGVMRRVRDHLDERGHQVALPNVPFDLDAFVDSVAAAVDDRSVLVGFSAAGPRLFAVAERSAPAAMVFLDARLPADGVAPDDDPELAAVLDGLPVDANGDLPPWTAWWPADVLASLVPDEVDRAELAAGCRPPPRSMFSVPIPAPRPGLPCGYLALGDGYAEDAGEAERRSWPVVRIAEAHHLWPVVRPDEVGDALVELIRLLP